MVLERRADAIRLLERTPAALRALAGGLSDDLATAPADGTWSPLDVVAHLVLSQRIGALQRIRHIVAEDTPALPYYDEDVELERSGLTRRTLADLLDEFEGIRAGEVAWLRSLPEETWARAGDHSQAGRLTANDLLHHAAHHDLNHLGQLVQMIAGHFDALRGPMQRY